LKAFTVEFRTRGKLGLCPTSEHVPWAREILFVGMARKVMSVQVTDVFNFREAAAFLIILPQTFWIEACSIASIWPIRGWFAARSKRPARTSAFHLHCLCPQCGSVVLIRRVHLRE
jgi:hypothetical protein